jgi:hypothetical protein
MNSFYHGDDEPVTFKSYDYVIGGKLVVGKVTISESFRAMLEDGDKVAKHIAKHKVKLDLVNQMAEYMLENKLIEFTWKDDHITGDRQIVVRAYLAPNDQVKILRLANKI